MKKAEVIKKHEVQLIEAGKQALEMRKQLAVTWLAAQEIIDAMRALRVGIPIPQKSVEQLIEIKRLDQ